MTMLQSILMAIFLSFMFGFLTGLWTYRKVTLVARRKKVEAFVKKLKFWERDERQVH